MSLLHMFLHNVILSTMFVLTPYFSILYKYSLEESGSLEGKLGKLILSRLGMSSYI